MRNVALSLAVVILACGAALGQAQEKVLYNFGSNPTDGKFAGSTLVIDRAGNLYGTTQQGGDQNNGGTVFELSPNPDGTWSETILYSFCNSASACPTGSTPWGLVPGSKGKLYGTTRFGGQSSCPSVSGCGVVFKLTPPSAQGAPWTYTVLYNFCTVLVGKVCEDGISPAGPPILDASGNLYGATGGGGENSAGTVYQLTHSAGGWTETVLYSFCNPQEDSCPSGGFPESNGLTFDKLGNLYGTTAGGGNPGGEYGGGTIYELSPGLTGWTETVVHAFPAPDSNYNILGPVTIGASGDIYTTITTNRIQSVSNGYVVRVRPDGAIKAFHFDGTDGKGPMTGVIIDAARRVLYGTTIDSIFGPGNVFQIDRSGSETVLYTFCQQPGCTDGYVPGGLVEDGLSNLYGTTVNGGNQGEGFGVVFEIIP